MPGTEKWFIWVLYVIIPTGSFNNDLFAYLLYFPLPLERMPPLSVPPERAAKLAVSLYGPCITLSPSVGLPLVLKTLVRPSMLLSPMLGFLRARQASATGNGTKHLNSREHSIKTVWHFPAMTLLSGKYSCRKTVIYSVNEQLLCTATTHQGFYHTFICTVIFPILDEDTKA